MAGPGGGGRSGGGGRGRSAGGSRRAGGRSGPPRITGIWIIDTLLWMGIVALAVIGFTVNSFFMGIEAIFTGGIPVYDEETFQDYTNAQYETAFGGSVAYEDNLLITVLVEEDCSEFYYIAWVGDHIESKINFLFGNNETELGQAMLQSINETNYKYSLDRNLAQVMEVMEERIASLELPDSFNCNEEHKLGASYLKNDSDLKLSQETVDRALSGFTDSTGIPVVMVVEDMEAVFGKSLPVESYVAIAVVAGVIALLIYYVNNRKKKKLARGEEPW